MFACCFLLFVLNSVFQWFHNLVNPFQNVVIVDLIKKKKNTNNNNPVTLRMMSIYKQD